MIKTNWIKMRSSLLTHPKVISMVNYLSSDESFLRFVCDDLAISTCSENLSYGYNIRVTDLVTRSALRYVTVSGLLALWSSARMFSEGGILAGIRIEDLDEMAGIPGFGKAIEKAGWASYDDERKCVVLKDFTEWNDQDFKETPKSNAERQKAFRDRKKIGSQVPVTNSNESNAREEKRREENNKPQTPFTHSLPETLEAKAAHLASEWWLRIPGRRKPSMDEFQPTFLEKLRVYGEGNYPAILEVIQDAARDKTQPLFRLWQICGLDEPPKPIPKPTVIVQSPEEIEHNRKCQLARERQLRLREEAAKAAKAGPVLAEAS